MTANVWHEELGGVRGTTHVKLEMAIRVADEYHHRIPTHQELQARYGMSRATAYRWLNAMRSARGQLSRQDQGKSHG
jgi:transposase